MARWNSVRLEGKVAVVTGASSDIGKGIVSRFVQEGARVVLIARNLSGLEKARSEIGDEQATVSISCDLLDESYTVQVISQIMDTYGRIDILVNNAGTINDPVHFHSMPTHEIKKIIDGNLLGMFHITKEVLARMSEAKSGGDCKRRIHFKREGHTQGASGGVFCHEGRSIDVHKVDRSRVCKEGRQVQLRESWNHQLRHDQAVLGRP